MKHEEEVINHLERAKQMIVRFSLKEQGKKDKVLWMPVYQHLLNAISVLENKEGEE
jgi:hypothetical protein